MQRFSQSCSCDGDTVRLWKYTSVRLHVDRITALSANAELRQLLQRQKAAYRRRGFSPALQ